MDSPTPSPALPPQFAELRSGGAAARVDLARAALVDSAGPILTPNAGGVARWVLLDRSPLSVRLAGVDGAGRAVARCRYEVVEGGVAAEVVGGAFAERGGGSVFIPSGG